MRVAVLGAGLQGTCVAMELAASGIAVDLYDRRDRPMAHTSAHNEGKLHLGFVYANDPSLKTARTMARGAVAFAPLLRRFLGDDLDRIPVSAPFHYLVHRDSLLDAAAVERHLHQVCALVREACGDRPLDTFGADVRQPPVALAAGARAELFDPARVVAAFTTPEIAIDTWTMAALVRARVLADPGIRCHMRTRVLDVDRAGDEVTVGFEQDGVRARERYDHVVNALWDGRLAVDATAGVQPDRPWLYRLRHSLRIRAPRPAPLPSVTIVLGPFGDVVELGAAGVHLAWYPAGMTASSTALAPPDWPPLTGASAAELARATIDGLSGVVPAVAGVTAPMAAGAELTSGIVFAWGETDIDDRASGLHQRHAIGPRSHGRYHSVDTGKLTLAPWFGKLLADRIRPHGSPR